MKYLKIALVVFFCVVNAALVRSQDHKHEHSHLQNEIGFSGGAIYTLDHNAWGPGMHVHYFRRLNMHSKWSLGGGIEQAWVDGNHFTIGAGAEYQIIDRLTVGVIPGITFYKHDEHDDASHESHGDDSGYHSRFSTHFEVVYDLFHWEKFHLGPTADFSWSKGDSHFMIGVHAAYCF